MAELIVNISPPKCGTTELFDVLCSLSAVARPSIKEPRFFCDGSTEVDAGLPDALMPRGNYGFGPSWFDALFKGSGERYRIDFTTFYAVTEETPRLLVESGFSPRFIFVLRDPISRFISHYYQYVKMGIVLPSLADIVQGEGPVSEFLYGFADYSATYHRYADVFGAESILALGIGSLSEGGQDIASSLSAFLDIDDVAYEPNRSARNVAGVPRSPVIQRVLFNDGARRLQRVVPGRAKIAALRLRKRVVRANTVAQQYPSPDPDLIAVLEERLAGQRTFMAELLND